jgi:hypothetical protein
MTPDFDAMDRMLVAMRVAYEVGDDKRVRGMAYLLRIGLNDLMDDDQSKANSTVHSARTAALQAGAVREDRPDDPERGRDSGET